MNGECRGSERGRERKKCEYFYANDQFIFVPKSFRCNRTIIWIGNAIFKTNENHSDDKSNHFQTIFFCSIVVFCYSRSRNGKIVVESSMSQWANNNVAREFRNHMDLIVIYNLRAAIILYVGLKFLSWQRFCWYILGLFVSGKYLIPIIQITWKPAQLDLISDPEILYEWIHQGVYKQRKFQRCLTWIDSESTKLHITFICLYKRNVTKSTSGYQIIILLFDFCL